MCARCHNFPPLAQHSENANTVTSICARRRAHGVLTFVVEGRANFEVRPNVIKVTGAPPPRSAKLQACTGASALTAGLGVLRSKASDVQILAPLLSMPKIKLRLLGEPTLGCRVKRDRKPNGHFWTDSSAAIQDCRKRFAADPQCLCSIGNSESQRLKA